MASKSNPHYEFDDIHHNDDDTDNDTHANKSCIEACQVMSSVDGVAMCGGVWGDYFHRHHPDDDGDSPYLYSPSAPVGPTSCEYCGKKDTAQCASDIPREYYASGGHGGNGNRGNANAGSNRNDISGSHSSAQEEVVCHRPKLFFLKKRPPFATPDGWDPVTEYRTNLFEPPSSVEGMGRARGEVRGQLGKQSRGGGGGRANSNNSTELNRSAASGCGSSCGGPETEISFSSAGDRSNNMSGNDRKSRSLSPVQWVSGLIGGRFSAAG